jgi:hypothetical protein
MTRLAWLLEGALYFTLVGVMFIPIAMLWLPTLWIGSCPDGPLKITMDLIDGV